jgi:hypothetical protein
MICPQCKAEYREGFATCADCEVDLVVHSPSENDAAADGDPFCQFWKGEDARVFAELRSILAEAEIPYRKAEWQERLFNSMRFPEFRLAVPFSMFDKAEQAVAEAYGGAEEADDVMHPTEENRQEYRKLVAWPLEEKLKKANDEETELGEGTDERGRD